jgi:hypothetical protein
LDIISSTHLKKCRNCHEDKAHRGDYRMRRNVGSSAEGNDYGKIKENCVIKQGIFTDHKMVPCQKKQITGKHEIKHVLVKFVAFAPLVFREHTHPNHDIPYCGQDGNKYGEEAWVEE